MEQIPAKIQASYELILFDKNMRNGVYRILDHDFPYVWVNTFRSIYVSLTQYLVKSQEGLIIETEADYRR